MKKILAFFQWIPCLFSMHVWERSPSVKDHIRIVALVGFGFSGVQLGTMSCLYCSKKKRVCRTGEFGFGRFSSTTPWVNATSAMERDIQERPVVT